MSQKSHDVGRDPGEDFSRPQPVADVPPEGAHVEVMANDDERARIARVAGLVALESLSGVFDLSHLAGGGLRVEGTVEADVIQTCVVTLEPVINRVSERVSVRFAPDDQIEPLPQDEAGSNMAEDVEPLENESIDLGRLTREFMLLGLDPYPRKAGIVFEPPRAEDSAPHPFAGLAGLRARMKDRPPE